MQLTTPVNAKRHREAAGGEDVQVKTFVPWNTLLFYNDNTAVTSCLKLKTFVVE